MEQLKDRILAQLRQSLDLLAKQLDDEPALAAAIRQERDAVPKPARRSVLVRRRPLPGVKLPELLYLALAHAGLRYERFDALRIRTDRARRLRSQRRKKAA